MQKVKKHGLVGDLWPHIRLMQISGHWLLEYYDEQGGMARGMRILYCLLTTFLVFLQFGFTFGFLILESYDADQMAASTITVLFFLHSIIKYMYFAFHSKAFYRTLSAWNSVQYTFYPSFTWIFMMFFFNNNHLACSCVGFIVLWTQGAVFFYLYCTWDS